MLKRVAMVILSVFLYIVSFSGITGCTYLNFLKSDDTLINSRIDTFLDAYNGGNIDKVLDCFDEKTKNTYKGTMNLVGKVFNVNMSDLFGISVGAVSDGNLLEANNRKIDFRSDSEADAEVLLTYKDKYTSGGAYNTRFKLVKEGFDWFICDIKSIK